jgi:hypothetical protein
MPSLTCVLVVPIPEAPGRRSRNASLAAAHGPYFLLSQAEYAARILTRLKVVAEIVPASQNGLWWVRERVGD